MPFDFTQLQREQAPWVQHNFGDRPSWMPLMGIAEELGELVQAATDGNHKLMRDGIADCIIFMADYCTAMDWSLQELWQARQPCKLDTPERTRKMLVAVAKMQHHHLKLAQGIRGGKRKHHNGGKLGARWILFELVWVYPFYPDKNGRDRDDVQAGEVMRAVEETWAEVRKRDWKKDPKNAGGHA
jgi:NTP pyrophosphatase (non-canonical NTP hydrolase)